ncbi:MAG: NUDIX domain-containing protein [Ruminococcus sp.]|nr:NUDIX domain-containing protein [Ruminococcus sp.]
MSGTGEKRILGAAVSIISDSEGRILLVKRCDCGKWGIPGGLMEYGETLAQAAVREAREETGLEIELDALCGVYSGFFSRSTGNQPITAAFTAHITGGSLYCDHVETDELGWFTGDELPEIYSEQHKAMLADYFSGARGVWR